MKRKLFNILVILAMLLAVTPAAFAQDVAPELPERSLPDSVAGLRLDEPVTMQAAMDASLLDARGPTRVIVRLRADSIAERHIQGRSAQRMNRILGVYQDRVLERIFEMDPSAQYIARTTLVLNALFMEIDAAALAEVAADLAVERVAPVGEYELDLSETVPYIGATAVQEEGYTGKGVRVAVLDSGVDYTHANLGGSGDPLDYENNDPTIIEPGTFPTAKVVGGYDFVGSEWPDAPEAPDPDPIDDGPQAGHGTHVADIIGGMDGVAPDVDIYAVKVCSSISTACSGIALIQGMEFAVDPDGDGDPKDHVDLINMSLGSTYGQPFDDDLVLAVENATAVGVLTVASAGNSADKPYVVGTPSAAQSALSVAQTQVPSASLQLIAVDGVDYPAVFQPWSVPLTEVISGPVQYGDGAGGNLNGCAPFEVDLTGLVVLVDRGACNFSLKISNISQAGGSAGIIGLVAPGAPFSGGDGGDRPIDIPGYMISQADSNAIKGALGAEAVLDPENQLPLVGQMVGSSSRGPRNQDNMLKPEIGAPGASVSAIAGTGTDTGPFGGTSGAAPMVTGSAALLMQAYKGLIPAEYKARLMNNGETMIDTDPFTGLAPISRIGGGEVRVYDALMAPAAAWDDELLLGSLSFGFIDVYKETVTLHKTVRVRNYSAEDIVYNILPGFRYADDAESGAVEVMVPQKVTVKAGKDATFPITLKINGALLWNNWMNSGSEGANGAALTINEFDGYLVLDDGKHAIHMPWHVLPRKAAQVIARPGLKFDKDNWAMVSVVNRGVGTAQVDPYSLIAISDDEPRGGLGEQMPFPDYRAVGVNTFPVPAGFCGPDPSFIWAFALNTWERQTHLLPVSHQVSLDIDKDGEDDYIILNRDVSFSSLSDGRQLTWVYDLDAGSATAFFFAEHSTNTGNTILYACSDDFGMTAADFGKPVGVTFYAQDFYFGGPGDLIEDITIAPYAERYVMAEYRDLEGKEKDNFWVYDFGPKGTNPDLGLLLITNGDRGAGNRGGATQETEAVLVLPHP